MIDVPLNFRAWTDDYSNSGKYCVSASNQLLARLSSTECEDGWRVLRIRNDLRRQKTASALCDAARQF